ncbi:MAG TPA: zinc-binding dehydrogenase [Actinobacteria bacterium]|jgi:propanol-preferring alcohol dehydrogenase|nr:zinc-binding dehydrogenase [Actinomycetota bacterium]
MKGWEFTDTHIPLKLVEKPDPVAKPGFVVIEVKAAGLCHSDVAALEDPGWIGIITAHPMYMGHENAGIITEIGEGVQGFKVGDRVGVAPISARLSSETGRSWAIGYQIDGGYADKLLVPDDCLVPLPDEVSFLEGAAATDAGMTSYHALYKVGGAKPGMKIGIIGIGGLGQFAAGMALIDGCEVYACDVSPEARKLAEDMGIQHVYDNVMDMAPAQCEVIVDYAGFGQTTADALEAVAPGGKVVVVGMGKLESTINTKSLILKAAQVAGSVGGTAEDIKDVYAYFATGKLKPQLHQISFEEIPEGLERLHRGEVKGRLVAVR